MCKSCFTQVLQVQPLRTICWSVYGPFTSSLNVSLTLGCHTAPFCDVVIPVLTVDSIALHCFLCPLGGAVKHKLFNFPLSLVSTLTVKVKKQL